MRALIGIWKIWNIGRFMSDSPLQGLWRCRSPPALVLRQLYGRNHCMWSVRQSAAAETPVRNFCCKVIESKSGLRVYPNLSVAQGMIRNQSMNTASFGDKNSFFFIEKQPDYDCRQLYLNTLTISLSPPTSRLHLFSIPVSEKPHFSMTLPDAGFPVKWSAQMFSKCFSWMQ